MAWKGFATVYGLIDISQDLFLECESKSQIKSKMVGTTVTKETNELIELETKIMEKLSLPCY